MLVSVRCLFCFKQKTAYEMRISDWSSDVCSSDLARGEIGELARHHRLHDHPGDLAGDAREGVDRLAELLALRGVLQRQFQSTLRHADQARRRLDAGRFERRHPLLEALALDAAQHVRRRPLEAVEPAPLFQTEK